MKKDTIKVYWGPGEILPMNARTNFVHRKPESLLSFIHGERTPDANQLTCPAIKDRLHNVFVLRSAIDDEFDLDPQEIQNLMDVHEVREYTTDAKNRVVKSRSSNLKGYYSASYMLTWLFFASEPVIAKFTAPYYPAVSPAPGALLATGEFDIGKWFRPVALDYHIPMDQTHLTFKKGDPLIFVEFMTDKKIEFQRFETSDLLHAYSIEHAQSPNNHGFNKTLAERYEIAENAEMPKLVLSEIKKNLV